MADLTVISLRVEAELRAQLETMADRDRRPLSNEVAWILEMALSDPEWLAAKSAATMVPGAAVIIAAPRSGGVAVTVRGDSGDR